jgi:hypothetical protein
MPVCHTDTVMTDAAARRRVAAQTLEWASACAR